MSWKAVFSISHLPPSLPLLFFEEKGTEEMSWEDRALQLTLTGLTPGSLSSEKRGNKINAGSLTCRFHFPFPSLKGRDGDELGSYVLIESIISPNRFNESHK